MGKGKCPKQEKFKSYLHFLCFSHSDCYKKMITVQWNLDLMKCQGTREVGLLYQRFVILRVCAIPFTVTLARLKLKYHTFYQGLHYITGSPSSP